MIISINDNPDIRMAFANLPVVEVDYQYTVGGSDKASDCIELIFGNWKEKPKARGRQGLFKTTKSRKSYENGSNAGIWITYTSYVA